jgi:hypothetical protein
MWPQVIFDGLKVSLDLNQVLTPIADSSFALLNFSLSLLLVGVTLSAIPQQGQNTPS